MGAVTGKGLAELIREDLRRPLVDSSRPSRCWSRTSASASASSSASAPRSRLRTSRFQVSVPIAAVLIWLLLVRGSYKSAERIFVLMTIPFFAYPVAAILAQAGLGGGREVVGRPASGAQLGLSVPLRRDGRDDDHAVHAAVPAVGGGRARHRARRAAAERAEVVTGSIFANLVAIFIIIATAATLYVARRSHGLERRRRGQGARTVRRSLCRGAVRRRPARREPACGGDPAGDGAYVVAETFGFEKGISHRPREAPVFVGVITVLIVIGMLVARDPGLAGVRVSRLRPGDQRRAAAGDALLRLAARVEQGADGPLCERTDLQRPRGRDGHRHLGALGARDPALDRRRSNWRGRRRAPAPSTESGT